jgi:hypothetical protein
MKTTARPWLASSAIVTLSVVSTACTGTDLVSSGPTADCFVMSSTCGAVATLAAAQRGVPTGLSVGTTERAPLTTAPERRARELRDSWPRDSSRRFMGDDAVPT